MSFKKLCYGVIINSKIAIPMLTNIVPVNDTSVVSCDHASISSVPLLLALSKLHVKCFAPHLYVPGGSPGPPISCAAGEHARWREPARRGGWQRGAPFFATNW
jgi:hypothetical protein